MTKLERRLKKLEAKLTDRRSGLVPLSPEWMAYWGQKVDGITSGEDPDRLPLEYIDAMFAPCDRLPPVTVST